MRLEGQDMSLCLRPRRGGAQVGVVSSVGLARGHPEGRQQKSQSVGAGEAQSSLVPWNGCSCLPHQPVLGRGSAMSQWSDRVAQHSLM